MGDLIIQCIKIDAMEDREKQMALHWAEVVGS